MGCKKTVKFINPTEVEFNKLKEKVEECCENGGAGGSALTLELDGDLLRLKKPDGSTVSSADLTKYLDDTTLSRVVSGTITGTTLTLTRDDGTIIDIDATAMIDALSEKMIQSLEFQKNGDEMKLVATLGDGTTIESNTIKDVHIVDVQLIA